MEVEHISKPYLLAEVRELLRQDDRERRERLRTRGRGDLLTAVLGVCLLLLGMASVLVSRAGRSSATAQPAGVQGAR